MAKKTCTLFRGTYELAHQSQVTQRDLKAEEIFGRGSSKGYRGQESLGWTLTDEQRASGRHGRYRFLIREPGAPGLAWTAFEDKAKFRAFLKAYGLQLRGKLEPGTQFKVKVPQQPKMRRLVCR